MSLSVTWKARTRVGWAVPSIIMVHHIRRRSPRQLPHGTPHRSQWLNVKQPFTAVQANLHPGIVASQDASAPRSSEPCVLGGDRANRGNELRQITREFHRPSWVAVDSDCARHPCLYRPRQPIVSPRPANHHRLRSAKTTPAIQFGCRGSLSLQTL